MPWKVFLEDLDNRSRICKQHALISAAAAAAAVTDAEVFLDKS
jgi:hypothetical protein